MKPKTIQSILAAALLAPGALFAQTSATTTPVGYETLTLAPNQFNLIGVRLFNSPVASGTFESFTGATLVDDQANFSLNATKTYIVEFPSGATILKLGSAFSGTTISGLTGIDISYQTSYIVREASTISSIFGAANSAGLASSANADSTEADVIYLSEGAGFKRIFYSTYAGDGGIFFGWLDADDSSQVPNEVIHPSEGIFVQTAVSASPIDLVINGEIKKTSTTYVAENDFTLLGSVYPVGATLTSSGLSSFVQSSANADATEADNILLPDGAGGFVRAFFSTYAGDGGIFLGWLNSDTSAQIPNQPLTSGFFVQKIGPNFTGTMTAPSTSPNYSTL